MPNRIAIDETIRAYTAAWAKGDREGWLDTFTDGATQEDPVGDGVRRGRDEIGGFWDRAMAGYETLEIVPRAIFVVKDEAAMAWTIKATTQDALITFDGIDIFTFDHAARIKSVRAYWERSSVQRQLRTGTVPDS